MFSTRISRGDADALAARVARDDAGASGEDSGSESGSGVEAGAARGYVREHAAKFVKAMGGELKITARFPEGTVEINQFEDVKKAAGGAGSFRRAGRITSPPGMPVS